jgi:hypothetical protein
MCTAVQPPVPTTSIKAAFLAGLTAAGCCHLQAHVLDDLLRQGEQRFLHPAQVVSSTWRPWGSTGQGTGEGEGARKQQQAAGHAAVQGQVQPVLMGGGGNVGITRGQQKACDKDSRCDCVAGSVDAWLQLAILW